VWFCLSGGFLVLFFLLLVRLSGRASREGERLSRFFWVLLVSFASGVFSCVLGFFGGLFLVHMATFLNPNPVDLFFFFRNAALPSPPPEV